MSHSGGAAGDVFILSSFRHLTLWPPEPTYTIVTHTCSPAYRK